MRREGFHARNMHSMHRADASLALAVTAEWKQMTWCWLDPTGITHLIRRRTEVRSLAVKVVWYVTWCGHMVTVDDVNKTNQIVRAPNCVRCAVALEPAGGA